jgi:hypothetical protein
VSTLRPEEIVRKAIASGYGNPASSTPWGGHDDDTDIIAQADQDYSLGDWVCINGMASGYPALAVPFQDGDQTYIGVVRHKVAGGEWCKVKTCGIAVAKVVQDGTIQPGDLIGTTLGSTTAKAFGSGIPCGRYLARYGAAPNLALCEIGGGTGGGKKLLVHHHEDTKNTLVTDNTSAAHPLTAPLWMVWKVVNIAFTGDPDPRLMTCIGGGISHGDLPWEGWAWGGVIGDDTHMGFGEIGGNSTQGQQGVLGAEYVGPSSDKDKDQNRINVRSWAGFNAHDRYGMTAKVVAPVRFTYCSNEFLPSWYVPGSCDCVVGGPVTTASPATRTCCGGAGR